MNCPCGKEISKKAAWAQKMANAIMRTHFDLVCETCIEKEANKLSEENENKIIEFVMKADCGNKDCEVHHPTLH